MLFLVILLANWLAKRRYFSQIGAVILVILAVAILANLGVIPSCRNPQPLYDGIFMYAAPLVIFFLIPEVRLRDLRYAGMPMILMFLVGSVATVAGVVLGYRIRSPRDHGVHMASPIAGMFTGTCIGGRPGQSGPAGGIPRQCDRHLYRALCCGMAYVGAWPFIFVSNPENFMLCPLKHRRPIFPM